jgi:hypothetical protein
VLLKMKSLTSNRLISWFFEMVTKGTFQVLGKSFSPEAFAGFAGIGHTGMLAGSIIPMVAITLML